jgi:ribose-phosphate pyrophosphokinase
MTAALHHFERDADGAGRLAAALGIPCRPIALRRFPDGESLVRVSESGSTALLHCSLDDPDAKLMPVLLAASALRDRGATHVVLVAPYLGYMRQDQAFSPGEAVSQRVIGGLIAHAFDGLVTVDPHLHRVPSLDLVAPGIPAIAVSAAGAIAKAIADRVSPDTLLVGPDEESRPWVEAVAAPLGLETMIGHKARAGDRSVAITLPDRERARGRPVLLVDDLISSGGTVITCAAQLLAADPATVGAVATHCLSSQADLDAIAKGGVAPVIATDSVPGSVATIHLAQALAGALLRHGLI